MDEFSEILFGGGDTLKWSPMHIFVTLAVTDRRNAGLWMDCLDLEIPLAVDGMMKLLDREQLMVFLMMARMLPDYDSMRKGVPERECLKAEVIRRIAEGIARRICGEESCQGDDDE